MTIFDGSKIPNGSFDPDRREATRNPESMSDNQIEMGDLLNLKEDADDDKDSLYTFADSVNEISQHELVYKCVFHLESDMLNYYYSPVNVCSLSTTGKPVPVLQGSPEFPGFYQTKWQVSVNFNRWIGMHRWISMYLTRVDDIPHGFQAQIEFKLVGKNGVGVFSQRNNFFTSAMIVKGLSIGFEKFLPFSEVVKNFMDGNKLSVEVHLLLISTYVGNWENAQTQQMQASQESHPQASHNDSQNYIDDFFYCPQCPPSSYEAIPIGLPLNSDIPVEDRIEIQLNCLSVAYAYREKLKEKSTVYSQCIANEWDCLRLINLGVFSRETPTKQVRAISDYVNFIHGKPCGTLENGTYRDAQILLQVALKFETQDLMRRCLTNMTLMVDCENATDHSRVIQKYCDLLNQDEFDYFHKFFRHNFLAIRKTKRFMDLKNAHYPWIMKFLFDDEYDDQ